MCLDKGLPRFLTQWDIHGKSNDTKGDCFPWKCGLASKLQLKLFWLFNNKWSSLDISCLFMMAMEVIQSSICTWFSNKAPCPVRFMTGNKIFTGSRCSICTWFSPEEPSQKIIALDSTVHRVKLIMQLCDFILFWYLKWEKTKLNENQLSTELICSYWSVRMRI